MKKIKLTMASALILLLLLTLASGQEDLWPKSQTQTYHLASDVLCGIGGESHGQSLTLKVTAGAQPSPIGKQISTSFKVFGGWVYASERGYICGDANGNRTVNLVDIVYLINYLFNGGLPPDPIQAGDVNCDGEVDITDVVYLINYLFRDGPPPCLCDSLLATGGKSGKLNPRSVLAKVGLVYHEALNGDSSAVSIFAKCDLDLAAAQFEIEYDPAKLELLKPELTAASKRMKLFSGTKDEILKIGILDLKGENYVPAGEGDIVRLKIKGKDLESLRITKATLVDRNANEIPVEIVVFAKAEEEKESEILPESFSLSQNYPNPFNPVTEISYALPENCEVRLVIYNLLGQRVKVLVDEYQTAGMKSVRWDGKNSKGNEVASGVYFYRIKASKFTDIRKMVLIK